MAAITVRSLWHGLASTAFFRIWPSILFLTAWATMITVLSFWLEHRDKAHTPTTAADASDDSGGLHRRATASTAYVYVYLGVSNHLLEVLAVIIAFVISYRTSSACPSPCLYLQYLPSSIDLSCRRTVL